MPRVARVAPGGIVFHVLNRGVGRRRIFDDDGDYQAFLRVLAYVLSFTPVRLCAYCLMPNHWHLVLWPRHDGDLAAFMRRLTMTHVRRWQEHRGTVGEGHLYQGRYKSFPVQAQGVGAHFLTACRYVERNALRAKLVERAERWPYSSLRRRVAIGAGPDPDPHGVLGEWPVQVPADWLAWVNEPQTDAEVAALRVSVAKGRPFGEEDWQRRTADRLGLTSAFRDTGRPPKAPRPPPRGSGV